MYRKNTAGQSVGFVLVNSGTGAALTGATVTVRRALDTGAQASATGTVTELGNGQYRFDLSQADTNADEGSYLFTATNAVPVEKTLVFTNANPSDGVRFGLTALPNAAANASGGVYIIGGTQPSFPTVPSATDNAAAVRTNLATELGRIDASITSRLAGSAIPTNFGILAIDAQGRVTTGSGSAPSANDIRDAIFSYTVDGSTTFAQSVRGANSALMGKASGLGVSNTPTFRDLADTKNRITATTDANGNRSVVVRDLD